MSSTLGHQLYPRPPRLCHCRHHPLCSGVCPPCSQQHLGMWGHLQVPQGRAWWHTCAWKVLVGAHCSFCRPSPRRHSGFVLLYGILFIAAKSVSGCGCKKWWIQKPGPCAVRTCHSGCVSLPTPEHSTSLGSWSQGVHACGVKRALLTPYMPTSHAGAGNQCVASRSFSEYHALAF